MADIATDMLIGVPLGALLGVGILVLQRWVDRRRRSTPAQTFSDPGVSVEVDCRACGQFNRVPSHRLRDQPKCGRCTVRLMPGKRVAFCQVNPMEGRLRSELNAFWMDEDRLWQSLADQAALEAKVRAEARDPNTRAVN